MMRKIVSIFVVIIGLFNISFSNDDVIKPTSKKININLQKIN